MKELENEINSVNSNSIRLERDKEFDPFGVNNNDHHHHDHNQQHNHPPHQQQQLNFGFNSAPKQSGVSFTSTSPLTQHNSLSFGPGRTVINFNY